MNNRKRFRVVVFTLALGFGVWTVAVTFTSATFQDGDVLSADELNAIINDNFAAAQTGLEDLQAAAADLEAMTADLETAAAQLEAEKFSRSGGTIEGNVEVRQAAAAETALTLDAAAGTVTNAAGSGLPVAFGFVAQQGWETDGTDNFSSERTSKGVYEIEFDGIDYHARQYTASVTAAGNVPVFITSDSNADDKMLVQIFDKDGDPVNAGFHFVIYENLHNLL